MKKRNFSEKYQKQKPFKATWSFSPGAQRSFIYEAVEGKRGS